MPVAAFLPAIIGAGAGLGGAAIAASGAKDAAQTQAASANNAAAIQKQMFDEQLAALSPYRSLGAGAAGKLGFGLGLPGFESGTAPAPPADPLAPNNVTQGQLAPGQQTALANEAYANTAKQGMQGGNPVGMWNTAQMLSDFNHQRQAAGNAPITGTLAALGGTSTAPGYVKVQAPNGSIGMVPQGRLSDALAAGGKQVG